MRRHLAALIVLLAAAGCAGDSAAGFPARSCEAGFAWPAGDGAKDVAVVGEFNGWQPAGHRLERQADGSFRGRFPLGPGRHPYRLWVDGEERADPANPLSMYGRDGREHSARVQGDCGRPGWEVVRSEVAGGRLRARLRCRAAAGGTPCDAATVAVTLDGVAVDAARVDDDAGWPEGLLDVDVAAAAGKHRLAVAAADRDGRATEPMHVPFWVEDAPFRWQDAVVYQVVTDRFRRGDGALDTGAGITRRMGGDLAGVTQAIEDGTFALLGVNVVWISPAYRNADGEWPGFDGRTYESYHGYWPVAARQADPRIGGEAALDALVRAAHDRGMRVLLDVVPNHVHRDHPYFAGHRQDWFNHPDGDCVCGRECSWAADIEWCWFTDYLPDLDWRDPEVLDAVLGDLAWWLDRFDLDGFRVDAVPMMPRLVTRHLRDTVDRTVGPAGPHVYLVGETFTGSLGRDQIRWYLGPYGLSGQFDFPRMWALRSTVAQGSGPMTGLLDEADRSAESWDGSGAVMGHILGNHDVPRFLSIAAGDDVASPPDPPPQPAAWEPYRRLAVAWAFLMTLPGAPVIYQGDEVGLAGAGDPDNRRPLPPEADWSEPQRWLHGQVSTLGRLRGAVSAMRHGGRTDLVREADRVAYLLRDGTDAALVGLSRGTVATRVEAALPPGLWDGLDLADCLGGVVERKDGKVGFVLPPIGAAVIVPRGVCPE